MSICQSKQGVCPVCHKEFESTVWDSLNADLNPEAKQKLIDGHLFDFTCPHCQTSGNLLYPLLYHDMTHHVMIQYVVDTDDIDKALQDLFKGPDIVKEYMESQGYRVRIVTSQIALREKVAIFDAGFDDCTMEIVKIIYAVMQQTQDPSLNFTDIRFINEPTHGPSLYFVCENNDDHFAVTISNEIYQDIAAVVNLLPEEEVKKPIIDTEWATHAMHTYDLLK